MQNCDVSQHRTGVAQLGKHKAVNLVVTVAYYMLHLLHASILSLHQALQPSSEH